MTERVIGTIVSTGWGIVISADGGQIYANTCASLGVHSVAGWQLSIRFSIITQPGHSGRHAK